MRLILATALAVALAACGSSPSPPARAPSKTVTVRHPDARTTVLASQTRLVEREPVDADADTLLYEYIATHRSEGRHEVPALNGSITCYGGPAVDGTLPVEIYMRRAVNRYAIVEDVVTIYPDDLVAHRRMLSMRRGPGVSDLTGRARELRGRALIADGHADRCVQALEDPAGAVQFVAQSVTPHSLKLVAYAVDADDATRAGIVVDALATPEAWAHAQTDILELASNSALMTIKGEIPMIEAERCQRIFGHFDPP